MPNGLEDMWIANGKIYTDQTEFNELCVRVTPSAYKHKLQAFAYTFLIEVAVEKPEDFKAESEEEKKLVDYAKSKIDNLDESMGEKPAEPEAPEPVTYNEEDVDTEQEDPEVATKLTTDPTTPNLLATPPMPSPPAVKKTAKKVVKRRRSKNRPKPE